MRVVLGEGGAMLGEGRVYRVSGWEDNEILPLGEIAEAVSLRSAEVVSSRAWQGSYEDV